MTSIKRKVIETHHTTVTEAIRMLYTTVESPVEDSAALNDITDGARTKMMAVKEIPMMVCVKIATQGTLLLLTLLMIAGRRRSSPETKSKRAYE
jgi:hypothetical protein